MSAGKSVDMTDIKQGHNIVNYKLIPSWEEKTGLKTYRHAWINKLIYANCNLKFQKPYVPVYDKTKKEIISMSAGKSVGMTDINHGHNIVNWNLTASWKEKTGLKTYRHAWINKLILQIAILNNLKHAAI